MNPFRRKIALCWFPAIAWASFIFFLSTLHASDIPPRWATLNDKVIHAVLFGIMSLTVFFAVRFGHGRSPWMAALAGFLVASLYGGSDEIHQMWTPSRTPDVWDWVADSVGGSCAFLVALLPFRHDKRS